MVRAGDLVAVSRRDDPEHAGRVHERLQQHHLGVPVFGGEVTRQVERGATISIFGRLHLAVAVETDRGVVIDAAQAASIAAERTGGRLPKDQTAALAVLPLDLGGYRLAWRTRIETEEGGRDCFVDAESAAVLLTYGLPEERRASGRAASIPLIPRHESGALLAALEDLVAVNQAAPRPDTWRSPFLYGLPDHYSGRRAPAEPDAIEANAAIVGHAFYLATEGGTNRVSGLTVEGVGHAGSERVSQAFLRAAAFLLPADSTFALARLATAQAARDLYGTGGAVERVIEAAWEAVGVR
jgi:Zn-dependent metalloprotease